jgi:hypothetical protein
MSERRFQKSASLSLVVVSLVFLALAFVFVRGQEPRREPLPFERGRRIDLSGQSLRADCVALTSPLNFASKP